MSFLLKNIVSQKFYVEHSFKEGGENRVIATEDPNKAKLIPGFEDAMTINKELKSKRVDAYAVVSAEDFINEKR